MLAQTVYPRQIEAIDNANPLRLCAEVRDTRTLLDAKIGEDRKDTQRLGLCRRFLERC